VQSKVAVAGAIPLRFPYESGNLPHQDLIYVTFIMTGKSRFYMKRRTFTTALATTATVALAGCSSLSVSYTGPPSDKSLPEYLSLADNGYSTNSEGLFMPQ